MKHYLRFVGLVTVLFLVCTQFGCAGSSKKAQPESETQAAEQKGSMTQTFKLVDEQGRKAGTLTVNPFGGAVLRDSDGAVLKEFKPGESPQQQPVATPSEPQAMDAPESEMPAADPHGDDADEE